VIGVNFRGVNGQIGSLLGRFRELPRHIAKKHLQAAMKRAVRDGVPVLKKLAPKGGARNVRNAVKRDAGGRFVTGSGKKVRVRGGALRRAVTSKAKFVKKGDHGVVYGAVGFKAGDQSRKAIWMEFGTTKITPRNFMDRFRRTYGGPAAKTLAREMKVALERAARELASGRNPGGRRS
jgi:hypothetical protein